jgi:hypothetical protein
MIQNNTKIQGFTLDTCLIIEVFKNPQVASFYTHHRNYGKKIFITVITLNELEHVGFDKTKILFVMNKIFGKIIVRDVTNEERFFGQRLESTCSVLHPGDSSILAFAKRTSTILVTLDKNLGKSCEFFNVNYILLNLTKKHGVLL